MKRIAIALFAVVMGTGLMVQDAEAAKRLGGGKSSGISRDATVMKRDAIPAKPAAAPAAAAPAAAAPAAAAQSGMSRWMGPLAGLAAGIGLAALFSHLGLGEGMANIMMMLLLGAAVFFALRWLLGKRQSAAAQPAMQYAGMPAGMEAPRAVEPSMPPAAATNAAESAAAATSQVPAGFDVDGFMRQAKLNFIRLQAANDRGDMEDVRQFCTPAMAAEMQLQFQERGQQAQETDVVQLDAELLDFATEADQALASVRFSGRIREDADAAPEAFSEVWHLARPVDGSRGWCIAGIQQH